MASNSYRRRPVPKKWIRNASDEDAIRQGCYFDPRDGEDVCDWIEEFCRQSKGEFEGEPMTLLPWQRDLIMRMHGWKQPDGRRRFTTVHVEIPKKNGKSTLISALALESDVNDPSGSPEIHLNARDKEQASIVFEEAARMVRKSPALSARFDVVESQKRIFDRRRDGVIRTNSSDSKNKDGRNASMIVFDELHQVDDRSQWNVMEYASIARRQPIRIVITTAGEEAEGLWYEQRVYSEKVNAGSIPDIHHLGIIYAVPEDASDADLDDPKVWARVNPSMGHTIHLDEFRRAHAKAKASPDPTAWPLFCRLRLGKIVKSATSLIGLREWDSGDHPAILYPSRPTYVGLDLSASDDLTGGAFLQGDWDEGFALKVCCWLPEDDIDELSQKAHLKYRVLARKGLIKLTPGPVVDYDMVLDDLLEILSEMDVAGIFADPYNAYQLCLKLKDKYGYPVEFLRQGFLSLNGPTKEFLRMAKAGRIAHDGHLILRNHVSNAMVERDAAGNIKISKKKSTGKIDLVAASINATAGYVTKPAEEADSVYEHRGIDFL